MIFDYYFLNRTFLD